MKKSHLERSIPNLSLHNCTDQLWVCVSHLLQEKASLMMAESDTALWTQQNATRTQQ